MGTNKSTTKWQQLYPSMFNVAGEVIIKGDHGAQVLGGAVIDAKQGITLDSGVGRLIVEAGATQSSSKNSSASIGVSYGAGGLTFSVGASKGQSKGTSYSPVQLITDGTLTIRSQNGADFLGVVTDVNKVDVGVIGDVNVVTLQNQFHSKSSGFGVSFTYGPGMATGSGISASSSKTDRVFTDNQTSIIGKESTVWNVSGNTNLVGSVIAQGTYDDQGVFHDGGNMVFNSGSVSYTHLNDKDISKSISGGINMGKPAVGQPDQTGSGSGTLSIDFSTTKGLTLATLGQGNITLTNGNIDGINRDVNGSQIITEHDVQRGTITVTPEMIMNPVGTVGKIGSNLALMGEQAQHIPEEIKGELNRAANQVSKLNNTIRAYTTSVPESIAGNNAYEDAFRNVIKAGGSAEQAEEVVDNLKGILETDKHLADAMEWQRQAGGGVLTERMLATLLMDSAIKINRGLEDFANKNPELAYLGLAATKVTAGGVLQLGGSLIYDTYFKDKGDAIIGEYISKPLAEKSIYWTPNKDTGALSSENGVTYEKTYDYGVYSVTNLVNMAVSSGVGSITHVTVSRTKYPESAQHILDAQNAGHPTVLTIDRSGAASRRRDSLANTSVVAGKDRDEYPPAMFQEGGAGASVRPIDPSDNRGAGACIGAGCRNLPDGSQVKIDVGD